MKLTTIVLLTTALASPAFADNIPTWSTQGCGLWTAQGNQITGPSSSISPGGGNYNIDLDLRNCVGQTGPQGPVGPQGPKGIQGVAGPQGIQGVAGPQG